MSARTDEGSDCPDRGHLEYKNRISLDKNIVAISPCGNFRYSRGSPEAMILQDPDYRAWLNKIGRPRPQATEVKAILETKERLQDKPKMTEKNHSNKREHECIVSFDHRDKFYITYSRAYLHFWGITENDRVKVTLERME